MASKANVDTACQMPLASCSGFHPFTNLASRASVYTLSQIPLAKPFPFSPFTIFASRASGYPNLKKQILAPLFLPLVGDNPNPQNENIFSKLFQAALLRSLCFYKKLKISFLSKEQLFGTFIIYFFKKLLIYIHLQNLIFYKKGAVKKQPKRNPRFV